jgi:flagella basal body P-ring formation protein FlgA
MSPFARGVAGGTCVSLCLSLAAGWWLGAEAETRLIVAAMDIPEGTTLTVGLLDVRAVAVRFLSTRKLGASNVAAVMGQHAPQSMRAGDFIDPTHFGTNADACHVEASATAERLALPTTSTREVLDLLERTAP